MIAALLGDLFMLPNLLVLFDNRPDHPEAETSFHPQVPHSQPQSIS